MTARNQMARTKVNAVGKLVRQDDGGLLFSLFIAELNETHWLEALANTDEWPNLGNLPAKPEYDPPHTRDRAVRADWNEKHKLAKEEWSRAVASYKRALHSDPSYIELASQLVER